MSLAEARSILGVGPTATRAEIKAAYARLMQVAHPDKGGTDGLAAQLNAARDRLLKG
jgi:curved DNA-binding protein CbpA